MNIPVLPDNVKEFFQYVLKRSKYSEGLMYIGDYKEGYVFSHKIPDMFLNMCWGLPSFLYVKNDIIYAIDRSPDDPNAEDMYSAFTSMLASVNKRKCYTITLEDDK